MLNLAGLPGGMEIWIIVGVVILLFGAKKIPELARSMGSGINQFKKGLADGGEDPKALDRGDASRALSEDAVSERQSSSEKS